MQKLEYYGISGQPSKLFQAYLSEARETVMIQRNGSNEQIINWRVPQGSKLGPILFLIYVNDLYRKSLNV